MAMHPWLSKPLGVYAYVLRDVLHLVNEGIREKEKKRNDRKIERDLTKEKKEMRAKVGKKPGKTREETVAERPVDESAFDRKEINNNFNGPCDQEEETCFKNLPVDQKGSSTPLDVKTQGPSSSHHHVHPTNTFNISMHYDYLLSRFVPFFFFTVLYLCYVHSPLNKHSG
jgi:hypothetical protein